MSARPSHTGSIGTAPPTQPARNNDELCGLADGVWATLQTLSPEGVEIETLEEIAAEAGVDLAVLWPEEQEMPPEVNSAVGGQEEGRAPEGKGRPAPGVRAASPTDGSEAVEENPTFAADLSPLKVLSAAPHTREEGGTPLRETFRSAMRNLSANKTRGLLTMLGIIIGVGAVVFLLAVGNAFQGFVNDQLAKSGGNNVTIQPTDQFVNGRDTGTPAPTLSLDDARALAQPGAVPDAVAVSPTVKAPSLILFGKVNVATTVFGVWPDYRVVNSYTPTSGSFVTDDDVTHEAAVIVLGPNIARTLFREADPVGNMVRLNGVALRVTGVMESKGVPDDDSVYVPLSTALNRVFGARTSKNDGSKAVDGITLRPPDTGTINAVVAESTAILSARHQIGTGQPDFTVTTKLSSLAQRQAIILGLRAFIVVVASISLLVGGIGIMNIMLVSVTERTREIGIRKAIGARRSDIVTQFLVEAMLISLFGAGIGVVGGGMLALIVSLVWRPAPLSPAGVFAAVLAALVTGLFFGISPARRAAALQPVEALRTE